MMWWKSSKKCLIFLLGLSFSLTMASDTDENKARYDFYRLIRLSLENEEQVSVLQEVEVSSDSYTFYGQATKAPQDLMILVPAHKIYEIQDIIERFKIKFKILERNVQKLIDDEKATIKPKNTSADDFGWDHYYHLDTIYRWMDKLINDNEFVTAFDLGKTHEGVLIRGLKISKQKGNTGVFVEAGIHAREWIAPAVATYTINELIHSKDPAIVDLALNFDWYFVPVLNADGYVITFEKDRFWRRNTQPYGRCRGVDLNRNFGVNWGGTGSSNKCCQYDFCGANAFSEPEAKAIKDFLDNHANDYRIKTYFSLHSFSQIYMFPYGHIPDRVRNYDDLKKIGERAVEGIRKVHGRIYDTGSTFETIYQNSGSSVDYAYENYDIPIAFTIELRGPRDTPNLFLLPADEIKPTSEEILSSFVAVLNEARTLGYYERDEL